MTLGSTRAVALSGLSGTMVEVEAHVSPGLPHFMVTGLPDKACAQAPERVRSAAATSGAPLPPHRITVNLSPASVPKTGSGFDLAIAVAVLAASGRFAHTAPRRAVHIGELALDGRVRGVRGVLPAVLAAVRAGVRHVVVPPENVAEAQLVSEAIVHSPDSLGELVEWYAACGDLERLPVAGAPVAADRQRRSLGDLADVVGQQEARAALELAAVGGHHLLLKGPPGVGKTMLAERLVTILPQLTREEALQAQAVRSLVGLIGDVAELDLRPPYEAPHHSASVAAIVGGGSGLVLPGAVSRAHGGVLFLDEAPEFRPAVLQTLRQPLESGEVVISRARQATSFPARFILVLAANPCPCGMGWGKGVQCVCTPTEVRGYFGRLSGPLMDRVDIQVLVPPVPRASLGDEQGESSERVAARVGQARGAQRERWRPHGWTLNGRVPGHVLRRPPWRLSPAVTRAVDRALDSGQLTLRGYDRVLRLAWSSADVAGRARPTADDVGLAFSMRTHCASAA